VSAADFYAVPPVWRGIVALLGGGGHIPDGEPGIRDVDAPCEGFQPAGKPHEYAAGKVGGCETDGHYICAECVEIDLATLRRRRDLCEDCGAKLRDSIGPYGGVEKTCSAGCK